jgi:hypothetical protein
LSAFRLGHDGLLRGATVADQRFLLDGHYLLLEFLFLLIDGLAYSKACAKLAERGPRFEIAKDFSSLRTREHFVQDDAGVNFLSLRLIINPWQVKN